MFRVLDLFSGIGGFSLGLERTGGFQTVAFCEIEPFCRRVLARHWPGVPCYHDIRELTAGRLAADGIVPDVLCGGFPCQDISRARSNKIGIAGPQSALWSDFARLIGEIRPRFALVENVADTLSRGLGVILSDLAEIGFDAEWHCIPASAVGAPHDRDRIWIVAHPDRRCQPTVPEHDEACWLPAPGDDPDANGIETIGAAIAWSQFHPWTSEPGIPRVAYGIPARLDRNRASGNAVVPQIPELIGRAILAAESAARPSAKERAA